MIVNYFLFFCVSMVVVTGRYNFTMDERWVCPVKKTCLDCLRLSHCSWCKTENKCFSQKLPRYKDFCLNSTINYDEDYGLSLKENAECSCTDGKKDLHCYPPGKTDGPECSDRGQCKCGHCICDPVPEYPTKIILGEYCEFDNFSCDGPKCNEGPYSISQPETVDDDDENDKEDIVDTKG